MMPNKCNINQSKIISYSERGIMDAIVFTIGQSTGKVTEFLRDCLKVNICKSYDDVSSYDLYLEHSLSEFGTPDLVIIVHYKDQSSDVIFIEAKVCSGKNKWECAVPLGQFYKKNADASNLFYQLYLKALLFQRKRDNFPINDYKEVSRSIGKNTVVSKFFNAIKDCSYAYYAALVPSLIPDGDNNDKIVVDLEDEDPTLSFNVKLINWETIDTFYKDSEPFIRDAFEHNKGLIYMDSSASNH
jgi:hypothetical protein